MTIRRMLAVLLVCLVWSGSVCADGRGQRPFRIYMALWRGWEDAAQGFKDYFISQHIPVELIVRNADQDERKLAEFVDEAKRLKPDLVFTWGTSVSLGMLGSGVNPDPERYVTDIPAVFAVVSQPTKTGLVPDLKSSGRNITGTTYLVPIATQISLIQSYRSLRKLGMIYNPLEKNSLLTLEEIKALTGQLDFTLVAEPVDVVDNRPDPSSIQAKVDDMSKAGVDFLYIPPDTFMNLNRDILTGACLEKRIPTFAAAENPVLTSKAMFGGVYRYYTIGQMTAYKAAQILQQNVKPQDIPVDAPKRLSIILNMPVVRQLELYPPMKVLRLAEIIDNAPGP